MFPVVEDGRLIGCVMVSAHRSRGIALMSEGRVLEREQGLRNGRTALDSCVQFA
jgi:hypothetical protein